MSKNKNNESKVESSAIKLSDNDLLFFTILGITFSIVFAFNATDKVSDLGMPELANILINVGCSVLASLAMSVFIYYKYLKHIPEENEKRINRLLNERLTYEASNHNTQLQALNPDNRELSKQHDAISSYVGQVEKTVKNVGDAVGSINNKLRMDEVRQEQSQKYMTNQQQLIMSSLQNISVLPSTIQNLVLENHAWKEKSIHLEKENNSLTEENKILRQQLTALTQETPQEVQESDEWEPEL